MTLASRPKTPTATVAPMAADVPEPEMASETVTMKLSDFAVTETSFAAISVTLSPSETFALLFVTRTLTTPATPAPDVEPEPEAMTLMSFSRFSAETVTLPPRLSSVAPEPISTRALPPWMIVPKLPPRATPLAAPETLSSTRMSCMSLLALTLTSP